VTRYFTGKAFAQSDPRTLQIGWAVIFRALRAATKNQRRGVSSRGEYSRGCSEKPRSKFSMERRPSQPFTIRESDGFVRKSPPCTRPDSQGRAAAKAILEIVWARKVSTSLRFSLEICASDCARVLVEEAIAKAFGASLEQVRAGQHVVRRRWSKPPLLASRNELARAELSLFRPIKMHALRLLNRQAEAVWGTVRRSCGD